MTYACLTRQTFSYPPYTIVPLRHEDIFLIKQWRNEQMEILRQDKLLTDEMQKAYFEDIIRPSFALKNPQQVLFSYLKDSHCIGYGGIVHIDWDSRQGEVSFLVDTERAKDYVTYREDFTAFLKLIKDAAFQELHLNRLYTETYDVRPLHISVLESMGFLEEQRLKNRATVHNAPVDSIIHGCPLL